MSNIGIDELGEAISSELKLYSDNVTKGIKKKAKEKTRKLVKETKKTAPVGKRKKHYKSNISSKVQKETPWGIEYIWYVRGNDYRLSHLLENGHQTRNGGRTKGTHFIKKASDPIIDEFVKEVEEVIENGG